jgi:hypothetical protein
VFRRVLLALLAASGAMSAVRAEPALYVHAEDRAAGSRHDAATALARALLTAQWPATVDQVRVDGVNGHQVAGIVLSGVKFHRALTIESFLGEVATLVSRSFANSDVEEVDVWATVPISVPKGAIVSGDFAVPAARTVFSCTVLRDALPHLDSLLHADADIYWAPEFAKRLRAAELAPLKSV